MWLFDRDNIKKVRPVLGIQLNNQLKDIPKNKIDNAIQLFGALFETMKDAHDARYISKRDAKNIIFIPSNGFSPIEFDLSDEKKQALMQQGRENAREFFSKWSYQDKRSYQLSKKWRRYPHSALTWKENLN